MSNLEEPTRSSSNDTAPVCVRCRAIEKDLRTRIRNLDEVIEKTLRNERAKDNRELLMLILNHFG